MLDFGLAKASREEKGDTALTAQWQTLGTPDFIAPEQILDATTADIRADIYSLGGTLYYLLTGRPPFQAKSQYDLFQAHISRDADPPNLLRPEVSGELAALVAKMMAKEPERRFQAPAEVAQALDAVHQEDDRGLREPTVDRLHGESVDPALSGRQSGVGARPAGRSGRRARCLGQDDDRADRAGHSTERSVRDSDAPAFPDRWSGPRIGNGPVGNPCGCGGPLSRRWWSPLGMLVVTIMIMANNS